MALLPARMRRLLVGGHERHQAAVIETLHSLGVMHVEDYADPTGSTSIGTPLEGGNAASEQLLAVRGLQKAIGCEEAAPVPLSAPAPELRADAEAAAKAPLARVAALRGEASSLEAEAAALRPLAGLELDLSVVGSLQSVRVFAGTSRQDPTGRLAALGVPYEAQAVARGGHFAVLAVVGVSHAAAAEKALADAGFTPANLPTGRTGTVDQRLAALAADQAANQAQLSQAEADLVALRALWGPRLAGVAARLADEVEKTQLPLKFAVTDATFHLEGWVPVSQAARVEAELASRFGSSLYVADMGDAPREHVSDSKEDHAAHSDGTRVAAGHATPSGHAVGHATAGAGFPTGNPDEVDQGLHHATTAAEEPPIHLENKGPAKPYEFLLGLLARPRYREVDPSSLMLVFFPLFFGLMVGDLGIGLLIMLVGLFLKRNKVFGIGGPAVGRSIFMGGVMSALVGLFVFGEAFGIHFLTPFAHGGEAQEISWEQILGLHFGDHGFLYRTGAHTAASEALHTAAQTAAGTGLAGILAPHTDQHLSLAGIVNLGYYSKTHDTLALLVWSMLIGLVHVVIGLLIGIRNVAVAHGPKLALQEKGAWLILMAGGLLAYGGSAAGMPVLLYLGVAVVVASIVLLWQGAAHTIGVGFIALLEVPGLAGNILSYTRLAAIGASKAGMAIAFASIAFVTIGGGNVHSFPGWIVYALGQLLILALAIIAGTLQSLRLQFVEFFGKFYTGGGRAYLPFGRRAA